MSSALIASTTPIASRLVSIEAFRASAQTRDHHFFEFFTRLLLGEHRVDKHCATNNGEQCF